jgi:ABC-2 type transport system permease protein
VPGSNALRHVVRAELIKLATLRIVPVTVAVTVVVTPLLALAGGRRAVEFGQVGFLVLGVLTAATEYAGSQIRTSLAAVPDRLVLLAGKVLAYLAVATPVAVLASVLSSGVPVPGATAYLVLIGLLALGVAQVARSLVGSLATVVALVFVVSPLLEQVTRAAAYLPDRAGAVLYRPGTLPPATGGLVLVAWLVAGFAVTGFVFARKDA